MKMVGFRHSGLDPESTPIDRNVAELHLALSAYGFLRSQE